MAAQQLATGLQKVSAAALGPGVVAQESLRTTPPGGVRLTGPPHFPGSQGAHASSPGALRLRAAFSTRSSPLSSTNNGVATRVALQEAGANAAWKEEVKEKDKLQEKSSTASKPAEAAVDPPSPFEIQSLLMEVCDETGIAELKIKLGSFQLHVKRGVSAGSSSSSSGGGSIRGAVHVFSAPPVPSFPMADTLAAQGSAPVAESPASPPPAVASSDDFDEGLLYVSAPTVGILRLARIAKGKRGRNLVEKGGPVKKGQVVCYVEQLGTQLAVESEHSGEVVSFLAEDGDPVGFGDQLISVRPSFPGIK